MRVGVDLRDIVHRSRQQRPLIKDGAVARHGAFIFRGAVKEVDDGPRKPFAGEPAKIGDVDTGAQSVRHDERHGIAALPDP